MSGIHCLNLWYPHPLLISCHLCWFCIFLLCCDIYIYRYIDSILIGRCPAVPRLLLLTLLPCAVESHPTPGDIRGSSSPSRSISGVSSHVADGGSARVPHECVHPSLSRSSSPSRSIHSPEHHVIFHPSCSHHVPKVA